MSRSRRFSIGASIRGRWGARSHNAQRASKTFDDRDSAILYAISIAESGDRLFIHRQDGTVEKVLVVE